MAVKTSITASDVLAAFKKWGVRYDAYSSDWATHNRNSVGNWGPINGIFIHNFASNIADTSSDAYLYRGDLNRKPDPLPGPLSQLSLRDDGSVGLIGWGRANHAGKGEKRTYDTAVANAMPLNGELTPHSGGTVDMNTHFIGIEMLYGGKAATQAQRDGIVPMCAALLDMLGGEKDGYGAGSVVAHRESTSSRSDPEGFSMATLRTQIAARLKAGPPSAPKPPAPNPPVVTPKPDTTTGDPLMDRITALEKISADRYKVSTDRYNVGTAREKVHTARYADTQQQLTDLRAAVKSQGDRISALEQKQQS